MKVIFMGTPDIAVPALEKVIEAGHEVVLVVSQPDKPVGRSKELKPTPVKECAISRGIAVYQPERIRNQECVDYLKTFDADVFVVEAFGQIVSQEILDIPKICCVNIHTSLLPKYRGAAPIQWAILDGELVTGVTTMRMDAGIDTGDIIMKQEVIINEGETSGSLYDRLAKEGAKLIVKTLEALEQGTATFTPQEEAKASHVSKISKEMGSIDWGKGAIEIERLIRGMNPWPSAYTKLGDKTLKIWRASVIPQDTNEKPGTITQVTKDGIWVQTASGTLVILELQLEGKKRMTSDAFLRGYELTAGTVLRKG